MSPARFAVLLFRFTTGMHLDGRPRSDATFLSAGTTSDSNYWGARWAMLPGWKRAVARWSLVTLAVGVRWYPAVTAWSAAVTAGPVVGVLTVRAVRSWSERVHYRSHVRPLHYALGPAVGIPGTMKPQAWLDVPRDYATQDGAQIVVHLPAEFPATPDAQKLVAVVVKEKLALEDATVRWEHAGEPRAIFTVSEPPPKLVGLAAVRDAVIGSPDTRPVLGVGRGGKIIAADFDNDSPHIAFSMGTGAGKSTHLRNLAAQALRQGAVMIVLDLKRLSHAWARGLPNVRYCKTVEEIHEACLWLQEEVERRNILADDQADADGNTDQADVGPRLIVLAEEMNATSNRLRAYWKNTLGGKGESPAVTGLGDVLFMGRQVKVNVLAVAQMFTARTAGGPEARENMGTRVLARYTANNWRMLVPEIWPMPRTSRAKGRCQVCMGGSAYETQGVYLTPGEAKELAMSGTVTRFDTEWTVLERQVQVRPVGLREACDSGLLPMKLDAARKAIQRDAAAPEPVRRAAAGENLYDPADLRAWAASRVGQDALT